MRFKLLTLIDITRTNARRGDDHRLQRQQQNYLTALQTISLRSNPIVNKYPIVDHRDIEDYGFGDRYRGEHRIWKLYFDFESNTHSLEWLTADIDLVPVIADLDETVTLDCRAFLTNDENVRNTKIIDLDK